MAELTDEDYAWDHAGENLQEDSPLLAEHTNTNLSFLNSFNQPGVVTLTRRQADYMINVIQDGSQLVQSMLTAEVRDRYDEIRIASNNRCCNGCGKAVKLIQDSLLLVTIALQVLTVVVLSIMDSVRRGVYDVRASLFFTIAVQTLNFMLLVLSIPRLLWMIWWRSYSRPYLIEMYVTCLLTFTGMYLMTFRLDATGWLATAISRSNTSESSDTPPTTAGVDLVVVVYVKMFHTSLSTASMFGSPAFLPLHWYNYLLQISQLIVSLTLLLCLVTQAVSGTANKAHALRQRRPRQRQRRNSRESINSHNSHTSRDNVHYYGTLDSIDYH